MRAPILILSAIILGTLLATLMGEEDEAPKTMGNPRRAKRNRKPSRTMKALKRIVRVYRNLNTGTLSAQEKVNGRWKVTMHPHSIKLRNAKFKVNQGGRKKVLKTKQKNVHAVIEGELVDTKSKVSGQMITYDPYKTEQFVTESGKKVFEAEVVSVDSSGKIKAKL